MQPRSFLQGLDMPRGMQPYSGKTTARTARLLQEVSANSTSPAPAPLPTPIPSGPRHNLTKVPYNVPADICGIQKALRGYEQLDATEPNGGPCPQGGGYGAGTDQHSTATSQSGKFPLQHCGLDGTFFDGVLSASDTYSSATLSSDKLKMSGAVTGTCAMTQTLHSDGTVSGSFCGKDLQAIREADCP